MTLKSVSIYQPLTQTQLAEFVDALRFAPRHPQRNGVSVTVEPLNEILARIVNVSRTVLRPTEQEEERK